MGVQPEIAFLKEVSELVYALDLLKRGTIRPELLVGSGSTHESGPYTFSLDLGSRGYPYLSMYLYHESIHTCFTLGRGSVRRGVRVSRFGDLVVFNFNKDLGTRREVNPDSPYVQEAISGDPSLSEYFDFRGREVYARVDKGRSPFGSLIPDVAPVVFLVDLGMSLYTIDVALRIDQVYIPLATISSRNGLLSRHVLSPWR